LAGFADGSIGLRQYQWLENVLRRNSSRYYDVFGRRVTQSVADELFVLFSHHTSTTMTNLLPDRRRPLDVRLDGDALVTLLQRFPNVVAWVNGHTHTNRITAHGHATPERAFWEINTAAHVYYPQHARIIEIADNGDGTLSLFTTLVEVDAPYETDYDGFTAAGLASLGREFAFNDPHMNPAKLGTPADRNTELPVRTR
jgi:metallophosphoesterase (TIGR03767 family)